jgi:hypothetical protein
MEKTISLSDDEIIILLELLDRLSKNSLDEFAHPGEFRAIWSLIGQLESNCNTIFSSDYSERLENALETSWNAQLIKIDIGTITTKTELMLLLAKELRFPEYFGMNWDAFDECARDFVKDDIVFVLLNSENIEEEMLREINIFRKCAEDFNKDSKNRMDILE